MHFCFPCWTADEKVPASKQPVNRKCCGQIWAKPRIPPKPRTKLLKGCCSFTPGMDSTFQVLLYSIAWNIMLHHPDDILKVYDCCPLDGEWINFWSSGPDYLEPLWGWARKRERMLGTCTTSRGRKSSFYVFHSPGGVSCTWCTWCKDIVKMDHCKSLMTDVRWWRRWWRRLNMVSSQCLPCPFQVLQVSSHGVGIVSRCCLRGHSYRQVGAFSVRYWEWKEATADGKQEQANSDEAWLG